jgi:hypothetical protein
VIFRWSGGGAFTLAVPLSKTISLSRIICKVLVTGLKLAGCGCCSHGRAHTPLWGVATTVVAGVSPVQVPRHCSRHGCLYIRRTIAGGDTSLRDVPTVHRSPITRGSGTGSRPRSRTPSGARHDPRRGCWPWSSCGCCRSRRSSSSSRRCRWGSCRRWCYCWRGGCRR